MSGTSRQYWSVGDTKALLTIWAEDRVQQQMEGASRNQEAVREMVEELDKLGIQRSSSQVREKLKKMRHLYKTAKRDGRKPFPCFELMDRVLGERGGPGGEARSPAGRGEALPPDDKSNPTGSAASAARSGPHLAFPRINTNVRPESRKSRGDGDAAKDFLGAMSECHRQWMEKEQELRREEWEREAELRREEMQQERALRREERLRQREMEARSRDSELLTSCLMRVAAIMAQDQAVAAV